MTRDIQCFYDCLSVQRMAVFDNQPDLYWLDLRLAEAMYSLLHCLEISLRNKIHSAAVEFYKQEDWWSCVQWGDYQREQVATAIKLAQKNAKIGGKSTHKNLDVLNNFMFGFWVELFSSDYVALWNGILKHIFVHDDVKRKYVYLKLSQIKNTRNKIAHFAIITTNKDKLKLRRDDIIEIINLLSPELGEWIREKSNFEEVFSEFENKSPRRIHPRGTSESDYTENRD
ncbi:MAG: hypothetical protein LBJ18_02930 [Rickettsiales bacterium]|jgi:hypothetical protein|nr:hypothetical protein [Rickettsiales bacterium]